MNVIFSGKSIASIVVLSMFLTGCGGGSDDSKPSNTQPPVVVPPVVTPPVVVPPVVVPPVVVPPVVTPPVVVPPANSIPEDKEVEVSSVKNIEHVGANSVATSIFNAERKGCGLGTLADDKRLTDVSRMHSSYLQYLYTNVAVNGVNAHTEPKLKGYETVSGDGNPFFTGNTFYERLETAKQLTGNNIFSENISEKRAYTFDGLVDDPNTAVKGFARGLLSAPYHMMTLLDHRLQYTGSSFTAYTPANGDAKLSKGYVFVSTSSGDITVPSTFKGDTVIYPCEGTTGVATALWSELPSPVEGTGRNLRTDPIGQPIFISMPDAKEIKVSNIKFHDEVRNEDVPTNLLDFSQDPHKGTSHELDKNKAFILPITDNVVSCPKTYQQNCGLHPNTKYKVSFDVLVDNKTLNKQSFSFTTGKTNRS